MLDELVRIENKFVSETYFYLPDREFDIFMHLASKLDPVSRKNIDQADVKLKLKDLNFERQMIPLKELIEVVNPSPKKWGGIYGEMVKVIERLDGRKVMFPDWFTIDNLETGESIEIRGGVRWFDQIYLARKGGEVFVRYKFSDELRYFLLQVRKWVTMSKEEIAALDGGHTKHLYFLLKKERDLKSSGIYTEYILEVDEFKKLLGISGKYKRFNDLKYQMIELCRKRIEKSDLSKITFSYEPIREGRRIKYIKFKIFDITKRISNPRSYVPTEKEIGQLSWAKHRAYERLTEYGVKKGIAIKQIIDKVKGGDMEGYEDLFIEKALAHFEKWSNQQLNKEQSAGTFVNWWTKQKVFDIKNEVFFKIAEGINKEKKTMDQQRLDNRRMAKDMTMKEFKSWYKHNQAS